MSARSGADKKPLVLPMHSHGVPRWMRQEQLSPLMKSVDVRQ